MLVGVPSVATEDLVGARFIQPITFAFAVVSIAECHQGPIRGMYSRKKSDSITELAQWMLNMCGRFVLNATPDELADKFGLNSPPKVTPRFNIAPTQLVAVVAVGKGGVGRDLAFLKWGLIPDWANDGKRGQINARADTVARKQTFAASFREKRCLIPTTGFYEWTTEDG